MTPTRQWPVIGHEWAAELLERAIARDQLSHAYLFTGPEGVGKTTLGLAFAQALLCPEEFPCPECPTCRRIAARVHPDVWTVEPSGQVLRVEQVRDVVREASRRPVEAPYRVFILAHMERAHPAAANALLKTLEEPPEHVVLILTAPSEDAILPTLTSRCQVLHLRPVPDATIVRALVERWGMDEDRARLLARLSGGRPGLALRLHEDPEYWNVREELFQRVGSFLREGKRWPRLELADAWSRLDVSELFRRIKLLERVFRDILMVQTGRNEQLFNVDKEALLQEWARTLTEEEVRRFIAQAMRTEAYLRNNVNKRLALDVLFLRLPTSR